MCTEVVIRLPEITIKDDLLLMELGNAEVIQVCSGYRNSSSRGVLSLTMTFGGGENKITSKGDPHLTKSEVALKMLASTWTKNDERYVVELRELTWGNRVVATGVLKGRIMAHNWKRLELNDVFHLPAGLPPKLLVDHWISLKEGEHLVNVHPYKNICPSSTPFSKPSAKDGTWHLCVDYRKLNKAMVLDKFSILVIEVLLNKLHGYSVFSKLHLKFKYHQIRMIKGDILKTTFKTHEGHYEFLVMSSGLTNRPMAFQFLMNQVFCPILHRFVLVFFDDILVCIPNHCSHMRHFGVVLSILHDNSLYANRMKCVFCKDRVSYLGHWVSERRVEADKEKIRAMVQQPIHLTINELRGFVGLTQYFRFFVKKFWLC